MDGSNNAVSSIVGPIFAGQSTNVGTGTFALNSTHLVITLSLTQALSSGEAIKYEFYTSSTSFEDEVLNNGRVRDTCSGPPPGQLALSYTYPQAERTSLTLSRPLSLLVPCADSCSVTTLHTLVHMKVVGGRGNVIRSTHFV